MKNIALILGAFAGAGNRANAIPMPDFNAVEVQGPRDNAISAKGSTQTDEAAQSPYTGRTDYKMPVENELLPPTYPQYQGLRNFNYNQDPRNFNPTFPVSQPQYQYQHYPYWQNQANGNEPQVYEPKQQIESPVPNPHQSLNLNNQQDPQEYKQPSFQDPVLETSNTEPAKNSEVNDSEVIDSEVIDSELINTELINTELINSELIDSELIDAVVVFDKFDCDLHEMPSVEDAQKKIQKYFFNSAYRFNGLNSIKILKSEGKKTTDSECGAMIVHYQASVLKSRSRTPDFFKEINIRIGLSFEDEYHSFGEKNEFEKLYAFKISDFMNGLINNLREEIDEDVQNMIFANDYDVTTEHRRMEFSKLKRLIGVKEEITEKRLEASFTLKGYFDNKIDSFEVYTQDDLIKDPIEDDLLEDNWFKLKDEFSVKKTRDERKKEERMGKQPIDFCEIEDEDEIIPDRTLVTLEKYTVPSTVTLPEKTRVTLPDGIIVTLETNTLVTFDKKKIPKECDSRPVIIKTYEPKEPITSYVAIDDLLAVLGEEEFMNKFIGYGNKKIATEIAQDKSDKEKKMKAAQYAIWKFVEDKTAREAEDVADLLPVAKKHVGDIEKLIEELTKQKKAIMEAENKPEDKNAGQNGWTKSLKLIEDHEDYVKELTKEYTEKHQKKELENAANDNLGLWLGMNGRPAQNAFFDWEWFNRSG